MDVDVLCCGLATLDLIQYVRRIPGPDEKITADQALLDVGGPAANAARTARALGSTVALLTMTGSGEPARLIHERLGESGVAVIDVACADPGWHAPVSAITIDSEGARTVVSANAAGAPAAGAPASRLPTAAVVLVDGHHLDLGLAATRHGRATGATVVLDAGSWKPGLEVLLPLVDVAVASADFRCPPQHRAVFDAVGVRATSHGGDPIDVRFGSARHTVPVPTVTTVDTLGAGDVLHGALAHFLVAGRRPLRPASFLQVLGKAAALASASCAHRGVLGWHDDGAAVV
jgi:sugar/nucleoside kinase (ribokinase family)